MKTTKTNEAALIASIDAVLIASVQKAARPGKTGLGGRSLLRPEPFLERVAVARNMAAKAIEAQLAKDYAKLIAKVPMETVTNKALSRRLSRSISVAASASRTRAFDAARPLIEQRAKMLAQEAMRDATRFLKRHADLSYPMTKAEAKALNRLIESRMNEARRKLLELQPKLAARIRWKGLAAPNPRAEVGAILAGPMSSRRIATIPAWDVGAIARSAGIAVAGARAGVKSFRFRAILDDRTTKLCESLHWRKASLEQVQDAIGRSGGYSANSAAPPGVFLVPPCHIRCRSILTPARPTKGKQKPAPAPTPVKPKPSKKPPAKKATAKKPAKKKAKAAAKKPAPSVVKPVVLPPPVVVVVPPPPPPPPPVPPPPPLPMPVPPPLPPAPKPKPAIKVPTLPPPTEHVEVSVPAVPSILTKPIAKPPTPLDTRAKTEGAKSGWFQKWIRSDGGLESMAEGRDSARKIGDGFRARGQALLQDKHKSSTSYARENGLHSVIRRIGRGGRSEKQHEKAKAKYIDRAFGMMKDLPVDPHERAALEREMKRALGTFYDTYGKLADKTIGRLGSLNFIKKRASYNDGWKLDFDCERNLIHELGHGIEYGQMARPPKKKKGGLMQAPRTKKTDSFWRMWMESKRAPGEPDKALGFPCDPWEQYLADDFKFPTKYMAKTYESGATEIVSMMSEYHARDAGTFDSRSILDKDNSEFLETYVGWLDAVVKGA